MLMGWRIVSECQVIGLENVAVRYRIPHERVATFKEHAIRWAQRRLQTDDFWALREINLKVQRGEIVGVMGRNGAGKSTLLKVIGRVLRPTQGRVYVRGKVAPLLEFGAGFHPELTGRENIFLNGTLLGFTRKQMHEKFERIVAFAELEEFIDAPLRTYSSGMVARLGFAVATDVTPDILILDEVLSVGDAAFQKKSFERIQAFRASGATILFVSHHPDAIKTLCTRALWIDSGRVVADGTAEAVAEQYRMRDQQIQTKQATVSAQPALSDRLGTRRIEITRVRLLDAQGNERFIFATGELFKLEIEYWAHQAVESPVFGMGVHRNDGVHITGPNTATSRFELPTLAGHGTVTFTVPYLALLEGLYHIAVAVHNQADTEMYDYHGRCASLRVVNSPSGVRERFGLITLNGEWSHTD